VVQEASARDRQAAQLRLQALETVELLELKESVVDVAQKLIKSGAIPELPWKTRCTWPFVPSMV